MNTPNKLTVLRMALVPVFILLFYLDNVFLNMFWALLVFGIASITDWIDGRIARSRGLVTDFGKFMDPLADKLLVVSAMICLMDREIVPALVVIVVVAREFLVTSLRLVAAPKGIVIAADKWGKYKTAFQMGWICAALFMQGISAFTGGWTSLMQGLNTLLITIVTILTVVSGANYLWKNRQLFGDR